MNTNTTQRTVITFPGAVFLPILLPVLGVDYAVYSLTMDKHRAVAAAIGCRHVEKAGSQIAHGLDTVLKDLTMFALSHEAYDIYHAEINQDIEDTFSRLMDHAVGWIRRCPPSSRIKTCTEHAPKHGKNGSTTCAPPVSLFDAGEND